MFAQQLFLALNLLVLVPAFLILIGAFVLVLSQLRNMSIFRASSRKWETC
jgi:hypothetical protein